MNPTAKRERAREMLGGAECELTVNVWDPLSARVAEDVGFNLGMFTGHGAEWAVNGDHQLCRVTISELAEQARRISRASDMVLMVTGPFGFGNALNVMRYVEDLESAGASILTVEDLILPLPFGSTTGVRPLDLNGVESRRQAKNVEGGPAVEHDLELQPHVSDEEMAGKLRAALYARQDSSLVIAARTNAMMTPHVEETVRRVLGFEKAGAEAVWFTNPTREGIAAVHAATNLPLIVGGSVFFEWKGMTHPEIRTFLKNNGVRMASLGSNTMRSVLRSYYKSYSEMKAGTPTDPDDLLTRDQYEHVIRVDRDNEAIRRFLN
jgi:oxaloacetate decarboxylase